MINKPAYQAHQIETGFYARRGEFIDENGEDYIGVYHKFPNGTVWAGETRSSNSFRIYPKEIEISEDVKKYRSLSGFTESNYIYPVYYVPTIGDYERNLGRVERFFVQKINNPRNTIMEVDSDQFTSINTKNKVGLNGTAWRGCLIEWEIKGPSIQEINRERIKRAQSEYNFIGLQGYLTDLLELSI